jgi:asparagine synthase (glutamine-hydrolysing)
LQIARYVGIGWLGYRLCYVFRKRTGLLRRQTPAYVWNDRPLATWVKEDVSAFSNEYFSWRREHAGRFFFSELPAFPPSEIKNQRSASAEADAILAGNWAYFNHMTKDIGFPPNWHKQPVTGRIVSIHKHWSQIDDFNKGDIKLIWEPSRFAVVYTLVRAYAITRDERYPAAFWILVKDWMKHNPPQLGCNWKCGQEAAIRLMAWCFGLYAFADSPHTTPDRVAQLAAIIAAHAERIEANIGYARSQNNNHALSEAIGLWSVGLLFPEFKHAQTWRSHGMRILAEEVRRQIYDDGSYLMSSINYHRVMLHALIWALRLGEVNGERLPDDVYRRFSLATQFLYNITDTETGRTPNYGANDGTLMLPLSTCDYNDFRPVLQAAHYLLHRERLFGQGPWDEDLIWLFGPDALKTQIINEQKTDLEAGTGGYYTLRSRTGFVFVRCATIRDRPLQADMLHVDLWWRGQNVALDPGTYSYNAPKPWNDRLAHTHYHNTVTVDYLDQMERVGKFLWLPWVKGRLLRRVKSKNGHFAYLEGEHNGYKRLRVPVCYRRGILRLGEEWWLVVDSLRSNGDHHYRLHWLLLDVPFEWDDDKGHLRLQTDVGDYHMHIISISNNGKYSFVRAAVDGPRGWRAPYYYSREAALSIDFVVQANSTSFWTLFGPGPAEVKREGRVLQVATQDWQAQVQSQMDVVDPLITMVAFKGKHEEVFEII